MVSQSVKFDCCICVAFSVLTAYISEFRRSEQDIHSNRLELRTILQRLSALPRENSEAFAKYKSDPMIYGFISGQLNQENVLLSRQAADLTTKLPKSYISATEIYTIANGLVIGYNRKKAVDLLTLGLEISKVLVDEVAVLRGLGENFMYLGKVNEGRQYYQKALDIFFKYPDVDEFTKHSANFQTEINWAVTESVIGNMDAARQHITNAEQILTKAPPSLGIVQLKSQLDAVKNSIYSGGVSPTNAMPAGNIAPGVPGISPQDITKGLSQGSASAQKPAPSNSPPR